MRSETARRFAGVSSFLALRLGAGGVVKSGVMEFIARVVTLTFVISAWVASALFYRDLSNSLPQH
jgi:hypothetical protein